jgi:hypothetical protein
MRRVTGRRTLYKLKDFKKVYVRIDDGTTQIAAPTSELAFANDAKASAPLR